jgi:CP family cyanate transporter-like MFS transporter
VPTRRQQILILVGLMALAFNLRPAASSVGPVIGFLNDDLGMSPTTAGVLTTLPVLCFAVFGALAPWFARRLGAHRVMLTALVLTAAGLLARAEAPNPLVFNLMSVPALAGMATANVLIPSLIKRHFPDRIGVMTSLYTTVLAVGMTVATALTVPIGETAGSWRWGIATWGIVAAIAALPWLGLIRHDVKPPDGSARAVTFTDVGRTRLGWLMAGYLGMQALHVYAIFGWMPEILADAGFSARDAGLVLSVTMAVSIPVSIVVPILAVRAGNQTPLILLLGVFFTTGYLGLMLWPNATAVPAAVFVGLGTGAFPMILTLIGMRSATSDGTAALSGFTQSVGYLIAGVGPFMMGAVYDVTGSWTVPLWVLIGFTIPLTWVGILAAKPQMLEDELRPLPSDPKQPCGSGT